MKEQIPVAFAGDLKLPPESDAIPNGEHPEHISPASPPLDPPGFH